MGNAGAGDEAKACHMPGDSQSCGTWGLGLAPLGVGESPPTGGYCDTPCEPTQKAGTPGAPPRQPSKGPSHGRGGSCSGSQMLFQRQPQECSGGDPGKGVLTKSEQSAPAVWREQGPWEEPIQEADKRLQVAKTFSTPTWLHSLAHYP